MRGSLKILSKLTSNILFDRPKILFSAQRFVLRAAYALVDLKAAYWVVRRPEWLLRPYGAWNSSLEPPLDGALVDSRSIAERVIAAHLASNDGLQESEVIPEDSIWGTLLLQQFSELRENINDGDVEALTKKLNRIFRSAAVDGFSYGTTFDAWPHRWHYLPLAIELSVITLAESIGVLRAECHEQGEIGYWRREYTERELIDALEDELGIKIEAPRAGDPRGIFFGDRFLTRETCSHIYAAHRIRTTIERHRSEDPIRIVEIGGGYGGTCYWLHQLIGTRIIDYTIIDLPEVGIVQSLFLGSSFAERLVLYGEKHSNRGQIVRLVPYFKLHEIEASIDIVINQDSMPEMPQAEVNRYLRWIGSQSGALFLSFNQEAYAPVADIPQVNVHKVIKNFPEFKLLSRDTSWDRRGYVEEAYQILAPDSGVGAGISRYAEFGL